MAQSKERHAEWMRERRGAQTDKVHKEGAQDWETISLEEIKKILPDDIVTDVLRISEYDRTRHSPISLELRLRRAYKYHLWHEANFTNGVHKSLLEARCH